MKCLRLVFIVLVVLGAVFALNTLRGERNLPKLAWVLVYSETTPPEKISIDSKVKLPKRAMVYKLKHIPISEDRIRSFVRNLGLPDEHGPVRWCNRPIDYSETSIGIRIALDKSEGDYCAKSTGETVRIMSNGDVFYYNPRTHTANGGKAPSADKCKQIAFDFLKKTKLLPSDAKMTVTGNYRTPGEDTREYREIRIMIDHASDPTNNSRADIQIARDGSISNLVLQIRTAESFYTYPLKDKNEVLKALSRQDFYGEQSYYNQDTYFAPASGRIRSIEITYKLNENDFFIPTYSFTGEITLPSAVRQKGLLPKCWGSIPAVKQRYLLAPKTKELDLP